MIWNADTMARVRRLYVRGLLDVTLLLRDDTGVLEAAHKHKLAEVLQASANDLGVDLDMRDIGFTEFEYPMVGQRDYIAKWAPMHGTVHLVGGPMDGTNMEVEPSLIDYAHPLRFPALMADMASLFEMPETPEPVPMASLEYRLSGYHENIRAWVYRYYL